MLFAITASGIRVPAEPGADALCPVCREPVRPKCGQIVTWHWAHVGREDCDDWAERDTAWHRGWQDTVPVEQREIVMGNHRADIRTHDGTVVELQHSSISVVEIREREDFYGRMVWIFDATDAVGDNRLNVRRRTGQGYVTFRWKHPRKTLGACRRPVLLDLGGGRLLRVKKIHLASPCGGWGMLTTHADIRSWMNAGSRVVLSA
jgi:competence protein CoiA